MSKRVMINYDTLLKTQNAVKTILNALSVPSYYEHIKNDSRGEYTALESFLSFKDAISNDIKTLEEFSKTVETIENKRISRPHYCKDHVNKNKKAQG